MCFVVCSRTHARPYILQEKTQICDSTNHKFDDFANERYTEPDFPVKHYIIYIRCNGRVPKNTNPRDIVPGAHCLKGSIKIHVVPFIFISHHLLSIPSNHCMHFNYLFHNVISCHSFLSFVDIHIIHWCSFQVVIHSYSFHFN